MRSQTFVVMSVVLASIVAAPLAQAATDGAQGIRTGGIAQLQRTTGPAAYVRNIEVAPEVGMAGPLPVQAGLARIWDLGVAWKDVNPAKGVFNFTNLDAQISASEKAGFKPMLVLGLTPAWAAKNPNQGDPRWGLGTASVPAQMSYWTDYVSAVVKQYGTRISAYEVWNEANLKTFWAGTPKQMAQMTKSANDIIKAANPNALVLAASVTTRLRPAMKKFVTPYVKALGKAGFPYDGYAIHTYP
ncbi:MAG: hypothetical protein ORN20_01355, partial [Candidatus Nanopelagicales bacterium]|nr:hypothetical protein [Candidatus Nanopelagicales bacterium]